MKLCNRCVLVVALLSLFSCGARADGVVCATQYDLGVLSGPGDAFDFVVAGDFLYVASGSEGLMIYSLADETAPVFVSQADGFEAAGLFVVGDYAYMAMGYDGVGVVDISDRSSPVLVGSFDIGEFVERITVKYGLAFLISDNEDTFWIVDVNDPDAIYFRGEYLLEDDVGGIAIEGDLAYVTGRDYGLKLLDIRNPVSVFEVSTLDVTPGFQDVVVLDDIAYVTGDGHGVMIIDVSNVNNPVEISSLVGEFAGSRIRVSNGRAYVLGRDVLSVADVSDPQNPWLIGQYTLSYRYGFDVSGDTAYVASVFDGARVLDVSDPPSSPVVAFEALSDHPDVMVMDSGYAYAAGRGLLSVIDARDPADPMALGQVTYSFATYCIAVTQGYAFVGRGSFLPILVFDVQDPNNPVLAYSYMAPESAGAENILIDGDIAYFLKNGLALVIADVSDPLNPVHLSTTMADSAWKNMSLDGDRLSIVAGAVGVITLDVSDPTDVVELGRFDPGHPFRMSEMVVRDSIAFVADNTSSQHKYIRAFEMSDPQNPTLLGVFDSGRFSDIGTMKLEGRYLYANIGNDQMKVIDVSDPSDLSYAGVVNVNGDFVLDGEIAYVASGSDFMVLDISTACLPCASDLTSDGLLNFFDISMFLQLYIAQDPIADFTNNGSWDFFDISAFLQAFGAGCP